MNKQIAKLVEFLEKNENKQDTFLTVDDITISNRADKHGNVLDGVIIKYSNNIIHISMSLALDSSGYTRFIRGLREKQLYLRKNASQKNFKCIYRSLIHKKLWRTHS